ncbi:prenyltransferase alpha subunit repeat-containing 1 [Hyphodiscus hymeniophilus]|uniref:Prenyltransferase alpha subunit repeat-containing 1 n=1 Tax=Hyphodiscus hymeniophilus TaxID=353542 RepID=A0A9P7AZK7_9HELO|nr:prenyltransferase alpha subunit repeat-containing 1 [Hyphodiscus hymeniophilus]
MSRALDPDAAASIVASNSQAAYNDIVEALNSSTSELFDIEFLGKSHPPPPGRNVLLEGTSIGLPKIKLVEAFVVARQIFFKLLKDFRADNFQDIQNATAVILLMDPEHITAANARKRIIQHFRAGPMVNLSNVLQKELLVIDSLLTSRLHRHTKSPTLWGHRRWLLEVLSSLEFPHDTQRDLETVILVAAERHPRNYYGWLHLRWLLSDYQSSGYALRDSPAIEHSTMLSTVKDWCLRHPADTSGWSFILFYLFSIELPHTRLETSSAICREVLGLAISFKWTHESVWVFLRTLVASENIQRDQRLSFFKAIEVLLAAQPEDSKARKILEASHDWCLGCSV